MIYICYATAFTVSLSLAIVFLALPLWAIEQFAALNFHLGLMSAACSAFYVAVSLLSGRISERLPIRRQLVVALLITALSFYLMCRVRTFALLVVLNVVCGIGTGLLWAPLEGVVSRLSAPGAVRANMGWYNLAWSSGMTIGYFLFSKIQFGAFDFGTVLAILAAAMILFLQAPDARVVAVGADCDPAQRQADGRRRFFLLTAWIGVFAAYAAAAAARQLFPKLATELTIGPAALGPIYGMGLLAQTATMTVMGRFGSWQYKKRTIYVGMLLVIASQLLIGWGSSVVLFSAGHVVLGLALAVIYSSSLYYSMEDPGDAHRNTSVHEALIGFGTAMALFMGYAADRAEYTRLSFFVAGGLALLLLCVQIAFFLSSAVRRERSSTAVPAVAKGDAGKA